MGGSPEMETHPPFFSGFDNASTYMWSILARGETLAKDTRQLNFSVPLPRAQVPPYVFLALLAVIAVSYGGIRRAMDLAKAI